MSISGILFNTLCERLNLTTLSSYWSRWRYPKLGNWHSWDPHPWKYPWLSRENLERIKEHSQNVLTREKSVLDTCDPQKLDIAFCGNIANAMYVRAKPLRKAGMHVSIYIHPDDHYVMSHPGWEEYDGVLPEGVTDIRQLREHGIELPLVPDVHQDENIPITRWHKFYKEYGKDFLEPTDIRNYKPYLTLIRSLCNLQEKDVLWCTQSVYMGYLARRPYLASQSGGDLWLESSRGDMLGDLMRRSFGNARILLASNPWSFAHARRFKYRQMIYLPKILDEEDYQPGPGQARVEWEASSGGNFFVLTTSRFDERNKGSSIGLEGFVEFSKRHPSARLVFIGWGKDYKVLEKRMEVLGIQGKLVRMPVSGKARLRDYLCSADVFLDQFVLGYFGSAGLEAMACGLPVIGRIEKDQYEALCETGSPPIYNCSSSTDVTEQLERLVKQPGERKQAAEDHRRWFVKNHGSGRWKEDYMALLAATACDHPVDFSDSPLSEPMADIELDYLEQGMKVAPPHPHYGW